jgi:outer membrane receptor for ferrienterochelin and colicin
VSPTGVEAGGHVAHRLRVAEPVTAEFGIRYDHFSQSDEGVFSPRGNLAVALSPRTTVRAAWGLFHQPQEVYQLHVQDGDADFYRAQRAQHRVVGVDHALSRFTLRAEAYQRVLSRLRPRYDNLFNVNSGIEEAAPDRIRLEPTSGEARGIELFASNDPRNRLRWYASYAWARVEDVIDGAATPRGLDQRHSALVETGYRPSERWSISSSWQIQSGRPYTSSTIATTTLPDGRREHRFEFGETYGERLPPYHRLDLRVTRQFDLRTSRMAVYVDVFNLYDRDNPRGWSMSLETDEGGLVRMDSGPVSNLPRLPSLGIAWNF